MVKWASERDRDVSRKREAAKSAKTVIVPPCQDRERRERLEACDEDWLRYYCGDLFWYDFTEQQLAMIDGVRNAILYGGDQAIAASRGEGKSKVAERMLLKYTLQGKVKFAALFGATATHAHESLQSMREEVEQNELLCADYPEVCVPVRALEDTPNRAHYQLVSGARHDNGEVYEGVSSKFSWCGHEIVLPNVPGSPAAWGVIGTRGLDSAVRGWNKKNRRPEVVVIDDPDTEETVNNPEQAKKLEKRIDQGIGGLGGQQRGVARIMLTTIQRPVCCSAKFTDPTQKPSWKGRRFRFLLAKPTHMDLWEDYMRMRSEDMQRRNEEGEFVDPKARRAHAFYLEHRAEMDEGAAVANENRFDGQVLPDGTTLEVSALQRYFNEVARIGQDAVSTEYDNDPPAEEGGETSGITSAMVASRISGLGIRELPSQFHSLVHFIDLGHSWCYWGDAAWKQDCIGYITDYGALDVHGVTKDSDQATLERALLKVLHEWRETLLGKYQDHEGQVINPHLCLVDSGSGLHTKAVYEFCRQVGPPFYPSKGFDKTAWRPPAKSIKTGDHWAIVPQPSGIRLHEFDATYWKQFAHQRFLTDTFDTEHRARPGSLSLFVCPKLEQHMKERREFAHQAVAELWGTVKPGAKPGWIGHGRNHYQDVTAGLCMAGSVTGIQLIAMTRPARPRMALKDMARKSA